MSNATAATIATAAAIETAGTIRPITLKLARVRAMAQAAGLDDAQTKALIFGCGGSPRRAKRALRYGLADFFASLYAAAYDETGYHSTARAMCNREWRAVMDGEFDPADTDCQAEGADDADTDADDAPSDAEPSTAIASLVDAITVPTVAPAIVEATRKALRKYRGTIGASVTDAALDLIAQRSANLGDALRSFDAAAQAATH